MNTSAPDRVPTQETGAQILDLRRTGPASFTAQAGGCNPVGMLFGGRTVAQALLAALLTVDALPVSSLHAYFLAPGQPHGSLEYRVEILRDSRRFANRQVCVWQEGRQILTLQCGFHAEEQGFAHQFAPMPQVPPPEAVEPLQDFIRRREGAVDPDAIHNFSKALPIELRPAEPERFLGQHPATSERSFWFRLPDPGRMDDPRLRQCLLAFSSDSWLAACAALPHALPTNSRNLLISSLDHALWFHRAIPGDDWLLHHTASPTASNGLGLAQGQIFDRAGNLIATTAQECLLRQWSS